MYLLDTNIWLERMLDQDRAGEVGRLLARAPASQLLITDFTLHSIGVILDRLNERQVFLTFFRDVLIDSAVRVIAVQPESMAALVHAIDQYRLDFDDAYQYIAALNTGATLVSFDAGFDRTDHGRIKPDEVIFDEDTTSR